MKSISEGFVLYDAEERLILCNSTYRQMYPNIANLLTPGARLEDITRAGMVGSDKLKEGGDLEDWIQKRFDYYRTGGRTTEQNLSDGRKVIARDERTREGGIVGIRTDITELMSREEELRRRERHLRLITDSIPVLIGHFDTEERYLFLNKLAAKWHLRGEAELIGKTIEEALPGPMYAQSRDRFRAALAGEIVRFEDVIPMPDGSERHLVGTCIPEFGEDGKVRGFFTLGQDMTRQRSIEAQLQQAQKMEAVGQLTGGMAHDFNNILGIVLGNLELIKENTSAGTVIARRLDTSIGATKRGATLVARLLAFASKQALTPTATDVVNLIAGMQDMLQRTLGETIEIEIAHPRDCWPALVDPAQLESTVLNLAINARDAMRKGGKLTMEIGNAVVESGQSDIAMEVTPGCYLSIKVVDTGSGMAPEVIERAFEPFYTTKGIGEGSGLGLSMTYGFVKQSNGHVWIDSEEGRGTTVTIYLPRAKEGPGRVVQAEPLISASSVSAKTVLVVEDEEDLRRLVTTMLDNLGYGTMSAGTAKEALKLLKRNPKTDLLLTDVVLAGGMSGPELVRLAVQRKPALSILYMSGYSDRSVDLSSDFEKGARILPKPFRKNDLARALLDAFGNRGGG